MNKSERQPKVNILMSSYNGEKYIAEQIESILSQTYQNITLYVRDDGSTDGTVSILQSYAHQKKLLLIQGSNIGFVQSFFEVMKNSHQADYYAWCDQDDIWLPDKIQRAVECLEKDRIRHKNDSIHQRPVLYFSDYDYYDEGMHFVKHGLTHRHGPSFANSLLDCISLGFNSVFNHTARRMMEAKIPVNCCGHDWWTYMLCAAFGRVIYDRGFCSVQYRRLESSTSPGGKNFFSLQMWRFKKFFLGGYFVKIRCQMREFSMIYLKHLSRKDAAVMALFSTPEYTFLNALKKVFCPVWFRQRFLEEMMVRVLFLTGKL